MTVRLSVTPSDPGALDAIYIRVYGAVEDPSVVKITGEQTMISPVFTQSTMPDGTGPDAFLLTEFTDGFTLEVYAFGDGDNAVETDPVYYDSDEDYTYPDDDELSGALADALDGLDAEIRHLADGARLVLLGGKYSGQKMELHGTGVTVADADSEAGPFEFGPLTLAAGDYVIDVIDDEGAGSSLLDDTTDITVA